jgi:hypothetical protein
MPRRSAKKKRNQRRTHRKKYTLRKRLSRRLSRRIRGGSYATDITDKTFQGIPVTSKAVVTSNGQTYGLQEFIKIRKDQDEQGSDL